MKRKNNNKYYILRHGEALSNKKRIISCWPEKFRNPLSLKGKKQIKSVAQKISRQPADKKIDLIFASDLLRTRQTAEIIVKICFQREKIKPKFDKRLREYNVGVFNTKTIKSFRKFLPLGMKRLRIKPPKGETYTDIKRRVSDFFREVDKKYFRKNVLIISHQTPLTLLERKIKGFSDQEIFKKYFTENEKEIKKGELREL